MPVSADRTVSHGPHARANLDEARYVSSETDCLLEETGFELPVPLTPTPLRAAKITLDL